MSKTPPLKVINLFGAPGVGKSSVRSGLFWLMKSQRMSVEEVTEYAKYLVLTDRTWQLKDDQLYLLAKQHHKQLILRGKYEYAVTDSPLSLCHFYAPADYLPTVFFPLVDKVRDEFENIDFYLTRDLTKDAFENVGRVHDLEASMRVDAQMREFLDKKGIKCTQIEIDMLAPWKILDVIAPGLAKYPSFPA